MYNHHTLNLVTYEANGIILKTVLSFIFYSERYIICQNESKLGQLSKHT